MQLDEIISSHNMPFKSFFKGTINKTAFEVSGHGRVKPRGTYDLNIDFTKLPPRFPPIAITAWTHSISCNTGAEGPGNGKSFYDLGIAAYDATRKLTFSNGGVITCTAKSTIDANGIQLWGQINGDIEIDDDPTGLVFYKERLTPDGPGKVVTKAVGTIFLFHPPHVDVQIESEYIFDKSIEMPEEQLRHVSEFGELQNKSYHSRLTSIVYLDREVSV